MGPRLGDRRVGRRNGDPNAEKVWRREGWGPEGWGPELWGARIFWVPKISRFFCLLPLSLGIFSCLSSSLSGSLLVEFWWCFGRSGPQMCFFSPSGCRVEAPGGGPPGQAQTEKKWGPEGWAPRRVGPPKGGGPEGCAFSLSRHYFHSFFLSWGSFCGIGGVIESRGAEMCTFEVLGLSCEAPFWAVRRRGVRRRGGWSRGRGPAEGSWES